MSEFDPFLAVLRRAASDEAVDGGEVLGAAQGLMEAAVRSSPAERDGLLDALREVLEKRGPVTGVAAMLVGGLLEEGADVARVEGWFVATLPGLLAACAEARRGLVALAEGAELDAAQLEPLLDALTQREPRLVGSWRTMEHYWAPFVAVLGASPRARAALRDQREVARSLENELEGPGWIAQMLAVLDDERFVAIDPAARRGYEGTFGGVADNFQLHTLLADALFGDVAIGWLEGARPSPALARCARGEGPQSLDESARGAWNLYTWRAFPYDPALREATAIPHEDWIWGEGTPADIPTLDGVRVIGLGPSSYERAWAGSRMFGTLRAHVTVTAQLDEAGVERWLARIAAEGPQA